jgi:hypothetical protein
MTRRNWIAVFTEPELRAALALLGTPDSASAVAAELYALPEAEQAHLEWVYHVLLLSCVSDDLARRVVESFAASDDARARMRAEQGRFRAALASMPSGRTVWEIGDVVRDRRQDCAIVEAHRAGTGAGENYLGAFSQQELQAALSLVGSSEAAARIAGEVYGIPPAAQVEYGWTDLALWLLSLVSPETADRVVAAFGNAPDLAAQIREMQSVFRSLQESGELAQVMDGGVRTQDIIHRLPTTA